MRDLFTRGKGPYGKVYEKLRKQSYRIRSRWAADNPDLDGGTYSDLVKWNHIGYVEGVRDALREVERGVS